MCGIAEFRCKNLDIPGLVLEDTMNEFTFSRDREKRDRDRELISVTEYQGHCLCEPSADEREKFLKIVRTLVEHSDEVIYSPNDYSDNPLECFEETWRISDVVERYWPSLETPPMRITVRPE